MLYRRRKICERRIIELGAENGWRAVYLDVRYVAPGTFILA